MRNFLISFFLFTFFFIEKNCAQNTATPIDSLATRDLPEFVRYTAVPLSVYLPEKLAGDQSNIAVLLNTLPGVSMQTGALNTNRISIRGIGARTAFGTNKIRAYLDEIPLTNGAGETNLEDIDMSFIHSVRVRKGPSSALFGAGLGGSIGLVSRFEGQKDEKFGESSTTVGSFGLFRQTLGFGKFDAERGRGFAAHFSHQQKDGYRQNNQYRRDALQIQVKKGDFRLLLQVIDLRAEIPSSVNATDFKEKPRAAAANWLSVRGFERYLKVLLGLSHFHDWGKNKTRWGIKSAIFGSFRPAYESRPFNILTEKDPYGGLRSRLLVEGNTKKGARWEASGGVELFGQRYRWETYQTNQGVQGVRLTETLEYRTYTNVFAEARLQKGKNQFILGGNLNNSLYYSDIIFPLGNASLSSKNFKKFPLIFSPKAEWNHQLSSRWTAQARVGHGFSPPGTEETQGSDGRFNPNIRPEQGWNLETGVQFFEEKSGLRMELTAFSIWVSDLLVSRRNSEDQWEGINAGKTWHPGLEWSGNTGILAKNKPVNLQISAGYAFSPFRFLEFVDRDQDFSGNPLTGVSRHQANATLEVFFPKNIQSTFRFQSFGKQPLRDDATLYSDPSLVLDAQFGKKWSFTKFTAEANLGVQNLLDTRYASMFQINAAAFGTALPRYYYPADARSIFGRISIRF